MTQMLVLKMRGDLSRMPRRARPDGPGVDDALFGLETSGFLADRARRCDSPRRCAKWRRLRSGGRGGFHDEPRFVVARSPLCSE
jgi:hypothetical protein